MRYGHVVQLEHVKSTKYVTVIRSSLGHIAGPGAHGGTYVVQLDADGSSGSHFSIQPWFKLRAEVGVGFRVSLVSHCCPM